MSDLLSDIHNPPASTSKKRKADEMALSEPLLQDPIAVPRNPKVIELLPEADTTIRVGEGDNALDIRVSSVVLGLASKVFKIMLSSQFIEARTKTIELTEDDPQVVLDFCHIIHHSHDSITGMDVNRFRGLLAFADMRDSREAIRPWMVSALDDYVVWMENTWWNILYPGPFPTRVSGLALEDIIAFAAVFDLPKIFWKATLSYLAYGDKPIDPFGDEETVELPSIQSHGVCLYELLSKTRAAQTEQTISRVVQHVSDSLGIIHSTTNDDFVAIGYNGCNTNRVKYERFEVMLDKEGIDPSDRARYPQSWCRAMRSIERIAFGFNAGYRERTFAQDFRGSGQQRDLAQLIDCKNRDCKYCILNLKNSLMDFAREETRRLPGLCLRCFGQGKEDGFTKYPCSQHG